MNITDISSVLAAALESKVPWTRKTFVDTLSGLAAGVHDATVDWDEGAGENWGRVLAGTEVAAIVFRPHPLVVMRSDVCKVELASEIPVFIVENMSEQAFSAQTDLVYRMAGRSTSRHFDPAKFSMDDLWWTTAT